MRWYPPLLALALMCCSNDPSQDEAADDGTARDGDGGSRDAGLDARTQDARVDTSRLDAASVGDARAATQDARPQDAAPVQDASPVAPDSAIDAGPLGQPNAPALTYLGTNANDTACARELRTVGYAPQDGAKHPLFLYFIGTQLLAQDESSYYDSPAAKRVVEAMSRRGFVAYSVEYDNLVTSFFTDKTQCLYGDAKGLLKKACALPSVDCSLGVATWGHSQGALLAHSAGNFDDRVRAVWTTGYSGLPSAKLAFDRLRVVNGENDTFNASIDTLNRAAGTMCSSGDSCLRDDGSGWIIVRKAAEATNNADHCWFDKRTCSDNTLSLDANWLDPNSSAPFALEKNADWVAATVKRP